MSLNNTSYSEVNDFLKCQQYWYNKYVRGLRRNSTVTGGPLAYGKLGHLWLEHYYRTLMESNGTNDVSAEERMKAVGVANLELTKAFVTGKYDTTIFAHLTQILVEYFKIEHRFKFDILAVEKRYGDVLPREDTDEYNHENPDNIYITMISDLVIRPHRGPWTGKIGVMDHKFSENFPADIAVKMNAQLPKQVHTLRENGIFAEFGILNYLRTRKVKDIRTIPLFRREYVPINDVRIHNFMREHEIMSRQIIYLKNLPVAKSAEKVTKVANPLFCGNRSDRECEFFSLCNLELNGNDTRATIKAFYTEKGAR